MSKYRAIMIYGSRNGVNLSDAKTLHAEAKYRQESLVKILYYGLAVRGKTYGGDNAKDRLCAIVEVEAKDAHDLKRKLISDPDGKWPCVVKQLDEMIADGSFYMKENPIWDNTRTWKKTKVKTLGEKFGVSCLYEYNAQNAEKPLDTIFTYGSKRNTIKTFNKELVGEVTAKFKDLSGNGIPEEFAIQDGSINVKMGKDGKTRLCFAVHMKSDKKDYADVKLQTKINELRKEVFTKYGIDIDIVDIRSTIEYV